MRGLKKTCSWCKTKLGPKNRCYGGDFCVNCCPNGHGLMSKSEVTLGQPSIKHLKERFADYGRNTQ